MIMIILFFFCTKTAKIKKGQVNAFFIKLSIYTYIVATDFYLKKDNKF